MNPSDIFHLNFLVGEHVTLAWSASTQRTKCYLPKVRAAKNDAVAKRKAAQQEATRNRFRADVLTFIRDRLLPSYVDGCAEDLHYENLALLIAYGTQKGSTVLRDGIYRAGIAQKLLNLLLKYFWNLGLIPPPPHCPVDRIILAKVPGTARLNWTDIDTIDQYRSVITALRTRADAEGETLAVWEATRFSRRKRIKFPLPPQMSSRWQVTQD
ncbi:hypothetical protein [Burkholderia sp. Ac-20349]|uniref:hypothetical protein n=1 Tax=Burkholderia sp. Ac-20349 TaxID=2703893 RepID=UPI00197B2B98|nr:hypothetical protein [Burkholderia sp. Ac-20349]MBN3841398.1 hypothetical protein [Burkholderia sp. Ac-20349]